MQTQNQQTHEFRRMLIEEMRRQGITSFELARRAGVSHAAVRSWVLGKTLPEYVRISMLVEVFSSEKIKRFAIAALEKTCEFCGRKYIIKSSRRGPSKTCSEVCSKAIKKTNLRQHKQVPVLNAIAEYCKTDCQFGESGLCRNAVCALAPFTPLPFAEPEMQTPKAKKVMSKEQKQLRSKWSKNYFSLQENRERVAKLTREALNSRSEGQSRAAGLSQSRGVTTPKA